MLPPTTTCPAPRNKWTTTKPSCPQAHKSTAGSKKLPSASTSNKHYSVYAKVMICSFTTVSPKPRMNVQPLPKTTPTMKSAWQLIPPMHNATNLLSRSPNADKIQPTAWVQCSIEPSKSLPSQKHVSFTKQNEVHLFDATSTPSIMLIYSSGANGHYISEHDQHTAGLPATAADHSANQYTCTDWPSGRQL